MLNLGMNERAWALVDAAAARAGELRLDIGILPCGARVLDAGVHAAGGLGAGRLLAELCMGGLGHIDFVPLTVGDEPLPGVQVWTDHPAEACMASQYAGWAIDPDGFFAMGSGPLRARARVEKELFGKLGYAEEAERGVLVLEGRTLPGDDVAEWVARKSGVAPAAITFAVAPTASVARRRPDRRTHHRDRAAQDGGAEVRRHARAERRLAPRRSHLWPRTTCARLAARTTAFSTAAAPAMSSARRTKRWPISPSGCHRPRRRTTARRSARSSSATTTTFIRSIRCCSARPRSG